MLRIGITFGCFTALASLAFVQACTSTMDDCENTSTCPPSGGASSGNAGSSGKSGSSAGGSASGTAGETAGGSTVGGSSTAGTGGADAGAGGGGPSGCDSTKNPLDESCLVSNDYAVFVAPTGDDNNTGTQDEPLASLTKAVEVAAGDKLVLVCTSTYDEHVVIASGAHIFGGFKCADWSPDTAKSLFKPTTAGPALKIDTVSDELLLDGLSFEVGDAAAAGETALTAIVNASPKVTLRGVSLKAGKGKTGSDGSLSDFEFPDESTLGGNAESPAGSGGAEKTCACQTGLMSVGALGGAPSASGQSGAKGLPDHGGGLGGDPSAGDCGSGSSGKKGADAPAATAAAGAAILGSASPAGWVPSRGEDGTTGVPGQGGGGGASLNSSGHGGGGGCGGCGGNGGTAGKGGGGSIALLLVNSPVTMVASTLLTADAGNGGSGVDGQAGQVAIGAGGGVVSSINACPGGNGGKGAKGGAGGGGAGGVSVGIIWKGAIAPTVSADTNITVGKAGTKGVGGVPGANDGIAGVAQKVLPLN